MPKLALNLGCLELVPVSQGAKLNNANLKGANLQRAYLRHVNLRDTVSRLTDNLHLFENSPPPPTLSKTFLI